MISALSRMALLDRLLHRVAVAGAVLHFVTGSVGDPKHLQRLVLGRGRGGEGEVAHQQSRNNQAGLAGWSCNPLTTR